MGLGYVGLTLGLALSAAGLNVIGIERRREIVDKTNRGEPHFAERGLETLLAHMVEDGKFRAAERFSDSDHCENYIITVGTPLDEDGSANLQHI